MHNKHVLMICCPTLTPFHVPMRYIERLGYEVTLEGIIACTMLEGPDAFSLIDEEYPHLFKVDRLVEFDIVAILVDETRPHIETSIISKEFVLGLKERVKLAEIKKGTSIRVVGINLRLSGKELQEQTNLFDGLFIARPEEIQKCLG